MALVNMKCPNCEAALKKHKNNFVCEYCKATIINFSSPVVFEDVQNTSLKDFVKKMNENNDFIIFNSNEDLSTLKDELLQSKISYAEKTLQEGNFNKTEKI